MAATVLLPRLFRLPARMFALPGEPDRTGPAPGDEAGLSVVADECYASWEGVYRDNVERVYRVLFAKVGNRPDAEDLTASVFLTALPRLRLTASVGEVRGYLFAVARTVLADHWRHTLGHEVTAIDLEALAEPEPEAGAGVRQETVGLVHQVLDALPERYRTILHLRFLQGASTREAARQMGVSVGNAKVLQYRALRLAARLIDGWR